MAALQIRIFKQGYKVASLANEAGLAGTDLRANKFA